MHKARLILIGTTAALAVGLAATPALADPTGDTPVTFTVTAGTLDITVPVAADLGATAAGGISVTGPLGNVRVIDGRAALDSTWAATVTSSSFTTGGATASETIAATTIRYWSGPATATTGNGTFVPGQVAAGNSAALGGAAVPAFGHTGGTGSNTATWVPTLIVNVPLINQAGIYTGTVTHSVA
jgi:hypothetical protein